MSDANSGADRRAAFRIVYPISVQPRFVMPGVLEPARVCDVSETGVRFLRVRGHVVAPGDEIAGTVRFHPRRQVDVRGVVVRVGEKDVALKLHPPGISISTMFAEQRHLMRVYPDGIPTVQGPLGAQVRDPARR